jgi:hypothetical protein
MLPRQPPIDNIENGQLAEQDGMLRRGWLTHVVFHPRPLAARCRCPQFLAADSMSLWTIVRQASRVPVPFVLSVRKRTVANTLSIGFVVRMCIQPRVRAVEQFGLV